jgi:hypothetical protein
MLHAHGGFRQLQIVQPELISRASERDSVATKRLNTAVSLLYYYALLVMYVGLFLTFAVGYNNATRPKTPPEPPPPGMSRQMLIEHRAGQQMAPLLDLMLVAMPAMVLGPLILRGSSLARQRSSYFSVVMAGLLCLVPCTLVCVVGIPIGICVLALISQRRVRHLFRRSDQQAIVGNPTPL